MTDTKPSRGSSTQDADVSLVTLATALLRGRRIIIGLGILGGLLGLARGLSAPRLYTSNATFVPQASDGASSELAMAASRFGINVPSGGSTWGPAMYVELLRSRALLDPIAAETLVVREQNGARIPFPDLMKIEVTSADRREYMAVQALRGMVSVGEERKVGAVKVGVTSRWPSVSLRLAERVVERVNEFNLETRKSQAAGERRFVEAQAADAMRELRGAEDRLQSFLQRNRSFAGPELAFERDRLQREVALRQELYTSWLQSREEARIREIRDTPVITVMEAPRLPLEGSPRRTVRKAVLGGIGGGVLGVLIALLLHGFSAARNARNAQTQELFQLIDEITPKFVRPRSKGAHDGSQA